MIDIEVMGGKANESLNDSFERIRTIFKDSPNEIKSAWHGIISRAQDTAKSIAIKEATNVYHITPSDIMKKRYKSGVRFQTQTNDDGVIGEIIYSGHKIPLILFNVSPKKPTPRRPQPVFAAQLRGSARKRLKNAFIATVGAGDTEGHTGVFERIPGHYMEKRVDKIKSNKKDGKTKHSEMIGFTPTGAGSQDQAYGPSMPQMVGNSQSLEKIDTEVAETIENRTRAEINRILNGYGMK